MIHFAKRYAFSSCPPRLNYGKCTFFGQNDLKNHFKTLKITLAAEILFHFYPLFIDVKRVLSTVIKRVVDIKREKVR